MHPESLPWMPADGWPAFFRVLNRRHFSPFKVYVNRKQRVVVVLNPKVGTKTLRQALTDGMREVLGVADPSGGHYRPFTKAREFPFARARDYAHAFRFPDEYQFFCFVRNPYARLRSAWQSKFACGHLQGYSRSIQRHELGRLRRFARGAGLPGGADGNAIPFDTFVSYVESQPAGRRDHHWDEQYQVLMLQDIRYERCFHMEGEFSAGLQQICARVGLAGPAMERILAIRRNASPEDATPLFTPQLATRVRRLYARDFEQFGYDPESWRGL